jgi:PAS domain S-box-containing protein
MIKPKKHIREKERLIELESFSIMDSLTEDEYDNITAIAAGICDTPISLVSLIDDKRQWFKSHHGFHARETPKDYAFCAHAIHDHNEIFMVNDSRLDDRFADNPLVTDHPNVIFYAGVPLMSENDLPLGTLCVIDNKPKELSENQIKLLKALAAQVMIILNLRKAKLDIATKEIADNQERADTKQQLNEAQKIAKIGSWLFDPSNQQSIWSKEMFRIWGFDPKKSNPVFTDILQRIHSDDLKLFNRSLEKAVSIGTPCDIIFRIHHSSEQIKTVRSIIKCDFSDVGDVVSLRGTNQDITEMDVLRTASESIATELRQFIETANAPIFGIDSKGMVNEWNQTAAKITGFSKSEVLGQDLVKTYITEDYQEQVKQVLDNALKGEETANYEFPLFTKDDKRVMVLLNSSTRRDAEGNVVGVLGVGQDITEMDALRTSSESIATELRQFIETANAPIFGIDSKGMVNEWNQTAAKITGFSKSEVLGQDLVKTYITEDYQEQVKQVLDNALKGEETANYEFPLFTKDDKRVMVLLNSSTRRDAEGNIVGVLGVGQDITEMDALRTALNDYKEDLEAKIIKNVKERTKELEGALEREKELGLLKSSFVSMASHQFRTPLAVIQSNAQLFEMLQSSNKEVGPEKYIKITDRITGEITKMTTLMDDVLILGKLTSGNVPFDPRELDLVEFCNLTIYQFNLIQKDGRRLDFVVKGKPYNVEIDAKLLEHSLSNLISNAFKYSLGKENPKLKVTYDPKGFSLTVTDNGIGIPKEDMNDLMQPFFRSNNSIGINGTGLGLSIAKEYIEVNKGTLSVNSTEGVGSSFEMKFKKS